MVADLFHYGHAAFLRQAKEHGDVLVVGIHSDKDAEGYKRKPILTLEERMKSVATSPYVDEVLANAPCVVTKEWIEEHNLDLVIHGDDFNEEKASYHFGVPMEMGIFRTVPYTEGISTTEIIRRIQERVEI
jgi:cytidyltransferase-like protein